MINRHFLEFNPKHTCKRQNIMYKLPSQSIKFKFPGNPSLGDLSLPVETPIFDAYRSSTCAQGFCKVILPDDTPYIIDKSHGISLINLERLRCSVRALNRTPTPCKCMHNNRQTRPFFTSPKN